MNSLAILTVDDEKMILEAIRNQLERNFGNTYLLEFAESAAEAMELTEQILQNGIRILLVISDYQMEGMKGDQFAIWLKEKHPEIKFKYEILERKNIEYNGDQLFLFPFLMHHEDNLGNYQNLFCVVLLFLFILPHLFSFILPKSLIFQLFL